MAAYRNINRNSSSMAGGREWRVWRGDALHLIWFAWKFNKLKLHFIWFRVLLCFTYINFFFFFYLQKTTENICIRSLFLLDGHNCTAFCHTGKGIPFGWPRYFGQCISGIQCMHVRLWTNRWVELTHCRPPTTIYSVGYSCRCRWKFNFDKFGWDLWGVRQPGKDDVDIQRMKNAKGYYWRLHFKSNSKANRVQAQLRRRVKVKLFSK